MARVIGKLTALHVGRLKEPGTYADGGGLYLQVTAAGTKSWVYRFMLNGHAREMGLGPIHTVSLAEARARAAECRQLARDGHDPIDRRLGEKAAARLEAAKAITFKAAAAEFIKAQRPGWRNAKHAAQWASTLKTYAEPVIGDLAVQTIDTGLVIRILQPLWAKKPETASRLRGRIEAILDWARVQGYREGENAARWRGHLDKTLPKPSKVRQVRHRAALPYDHLPDFMAALRNRQGISARALEFAILTAARTGEAIGARWSEINMASKTWTVPAERMKGGREHRVPLNNRAIEVLSGMRELAVEGCRGDSIVFPGSKAGHLLTDMALVTVIRRMNAETDPPNWRDSDGRPVVPHGFRASFKTWAGACTNFQREVVEAALAHAIGDKTEAAYERGDRLEKRRRLLAAWCEYCRTPKKTGKVVPIRASQ